MEKEEYEKFYKAVSKVGGRERAGLSPGLKQRQRLKHAGRGQVKVRHPDRGWLVAP